MRSMLSMLRARCHKEAETAIRQQQLIGTRSFGLLLADDAFGRESPTKGPFMR